MPIYAIAMKSYYGNPDSHVYFGEKWTKNMYRALLFEEKEDALDFANIHFNNFNKWFVEDITSKIDINNLQGEDREIYLSIIEKDAHSFSEIKSNGDIISEIII